MAWMVRTAVPANSGGTSGTTNPGWYLAEVVAYSYPTAVVTMYPDRRGVTLSLLNCSGNTLVANQIVAVLGNGTAADVIV